MKDETLQRVVDDMLSGLNVLAVGKDAEAGRVHMTDFMRLYGVELGAVCSPPSVTIRLHNGSRARFVSLAGDPEFCRGFGAVLHFMDSVDGSESSYPRWLELQRLNERHRDVVRPDG